MPSITTTVSTDWANRFEAYARDYYLWDGPGSDTRTVPDLWKLEMNQIKQRVLIFERNTRAEFGGTVPPPLSDPT